MNCVKTPPPSVFNTQSDCMIEYLEEQYRVHLNGKKTSLYPHQIEAVLKLPDYFTNTENNPDLSDTALVVLPTGCGKTGVAVLASYALGASRVLVITPSIIVSRQIDAAYGSYLINYKVIEDKPENVQCALPTKSFIKKSTEIPEGMKSMVMIVNAHKIGGKSSMKIEDIPKDGYDLVIVDEAHHYPAPTWKLVVDHFTDSLKLFLTATPERKGKSILSMPPCYQLKRSVAVERGIIREVKFYEVPGGDWNAEEDRYSAIATRVEQYLDEHDKLDPTVKHQGMVLAQTKTGLNPAETFCDIYNALYPNKCAVYVSETRRDILQGFISGEIRTLVIVGRLLEGFDHKPVSVLGIIRNIAPTSRVLFAQFVGRAVRRNSSDDPVPAQIVTHQYYNQRQNFDTFEELAEEEPTDAYN